MIITGNVNATFNVTETFTYGFATSQANTARIDPTNSFGNGTTNANCDLHYEKSAVTLASGASVTYTLSALTDDLGRAVAFVKVRAMIIQVTSRTAADYLTVGAAASNPWLAFLGGTTPTMKVYDLDVKVASTDGFTVTASSSDQLKITNSGAASMTFKIGFLGTSA